MNTAVTLPVSVLSSIPFHPDMGILVRKVVVSKSTWLRTIKHPSVDFTPCRSIYLRMRFGIAGTLCEGRVPVFTTTSEHLLGVTAGIASEACIVFDAQVSKDTIHAFATAMKGKVVNLEDRNKFQISGVV